MHKSGFINFTVLISLNYLGILIFIMIMVLLCVVSTIKLLHTTCTLNDYQ